MDSHELSNLLLLEWTLVAALERSGGLGTVDLCSDRSELSLPSNRSQDAFLKPKRPSVSAMAFAVLRTVYSCLLKFVRTLNVAYEQI